MPCQHRSTICTFPFRPISILVSKQKQNAPDDPQPSWSGKLLKHGLRNEKEQRCITPLPTTPRRLPVLPTTWMRMWKKLLPNIFLMVDAGLRTALSLW